MPHVGAIAHFATEENLYFPGTVSYTADMHPVLFEIPIFGGLRIYTYGVLVALGFLAGMWWVSHEAKRVGEDPSKATDLVFYIIIAAIVGSRIAHVLLADRAHFLAEPLSFFRIWEGGLIFHGGLIAAILTAIWYTRRHRRSFWVYADIFAPAIALGHAIGRLGCLAAGCCHGLPVPGGDHWWAIVFPPNALSFAPPGVPLYPTQLFEAGGEFLIFLTLITLRHRIRFAGRLFALYLMIYGLLRFLVEPLRGTETRDHLISNTLSAGQEISVLAIVLAVVIWIARGKRREHA